MRWTPAVVNPNEPKARPRRPVLRAVGDTPAPGPSAGQDEPESPDTLFACHKLAHDLGDEAIDGAISRGRDGLDRIRLFLLDYIEALARELGACTMLTDVESLTPEHRRQIEARRESFDRRLRAIIREGVEDGSLTACDPRFGGLLIMAAQSWIPQCYSPDGDHSGKQIAESFVDMLVSGLDARRQA